MPLLVCLDQVTDPRNLGAVIALARRGPVRPASSSRRTAPPASRRPSAGRLPGAVEHLPVAVVPNLARYLAEVKSNTVWVYAATAEGGTPMWKADLSGGVALVLGAEGKGIRPLVRRTCDGAVSIPLAVGVESLNVSVAAAVLLYEAARQRS